MNAVTNMHFSRRKFTITGAKLAAAAAVIGLSATGCSSASTDVASAAAVKAEDVVLVESVRSLSNPYHANWVKGGQMFADSMGMPVKVVTDDSDSQKQLSQIRALANSGKKIILNVDPNTSSDTQAIVRAVKDAGGFVVTQWNKPDELNPWDVGNNWVAHIGFDGRVSGKQVAEKLFESMGGSGGVIALQGILDNVSAKQRFEGLQTAMKEAPGIELLDQQAANWNRNTAFQVTQTLLAKHGDKVKGVWAANDDMALGALQALKAAGLAGQVPIVGIDAVPEALSEVQSGANKYVATVSSDAYWQGGAALSLAYKAATGEIDISKLSHDQRAFYGTQMLVTQANVADHLSAPTADSLKQDFDDPFRRMTAPIN